ncbi:hypothetical protein OG301_33820 [Streptomyces platensis]|nr:hypothetical protein OG229_05240 [Streptomyces platensis]WTI57227.1 hypothetical protein OG301_33820 [Streptomyces platensis]WUB84652.1 hypothetical protein OG424_04730 [Streptomyces platensis]
MTALARSERAARTVSDLGATPVAGALTDTDVLREAAQGRRGHSPRGDYAEGTADVDRAAAQRRRHCRTVLPSHLYRRPSALRRLGQHQRRPLGSRLLPTLPLPTPPGIPGKPSTAPDVWWPARIRESAA